MGVALTFPGAAEVIEAVYDELRNIYQAAPPAINVVDEPAGDFGIAHFWGLDGRTSVEYDFLESFDKDRIPARYVICHELGHAISLNVTLARGDDPFTNGLYDEFWKARGFPGTPWDAQQRAMDMERTLTNSGYRYWPEENFADAFGAVNSYGQGSLITAFYGVWLDEPKMRDFYKGLRGKYMGLTDEDVTKVARAVANFILPEVLAKLDAGFNVTLTAVADRIVAGDKKTATAELDK